jgi:2-polyprenyl-3-methyl-5-hydroxy-6-metoxy-1,4-benzoquinol methylase
MITKCNVCNSNELTKIRTISEPDRFEIFVGIEMKGFFRYWLECNKCGIGINFHEPENLTKIKTISENYYEADFGLVDLSERFKKITDLPLDKSDNKLRVKRIKSFLNDFNFDINNSNFKTQSYKRKVLDIGSGLGIFLAEFIDSNWSGMAIEPDPKAVLHLIELKSKFQNLEIFEGIYNSQDHFKNYDLVTLNKVLEHVENPLDLLYSVQTALKENTGIVYVEVPDKLSLNYKENNDNSLGSLHFNLYDPLSLSNLFHYSGFEPISVSRIYEPSGKLTTFGFAIPKKNYKKRTTF